LALALWTQATLAQSDDPPVAKTTGYLPSISDFMIATIQRRHVRPWVAAHGKDWPFAAYETRKSKRRLRSPRPGSSHGARDSAARHDLVGHRTTLEHLRKAILAKDAMVFDKAYGDLRMQCLSPGHKPWRRRHSSADGHIAFGPGILAVWLLKGAAP
jgi:hypothetical protein